VEPQVSKVLKHAIAGAVALMALATTSLPSSAMSVENMSPIVAADAAAQLGLQHVWWRRYYVYRPRVFVYRRFYHPYYHPYYRWHRRYWY
jgi:hypothetical protein